MHYRYPLANVGNNLQCSRFCVHKSGLYVHMTPHPKTKTKEMHVYLLVEKEFPAMITGNFFA